MNGCDWGGVDSILKNRLVRLIILTTSHLVVEEKKKNSYES